MFARGSGSGSERVKGDYLEENTMKRALGCIVLVLMLAAVVSAQQGSTGTIAGTVSDPSGQAIPGAKVRLTFELNGEERAEVTNETGDFFFGALTAGLYTVRVEATGFRPLE